MAKITVNRPNFIQSDVDLRFVSYGVNESSTTVTVSSETDAKGVAHKVVKAGAIVSDTTKGVLGFVYQDIDVTGYTGTKAQVASVMVSGHFYNDTTGLPVVATADQITNMAKHGLYAETRPSVTRPYGSQTL